MDIYDVPKVPIKNTFDKELEIAINNLENKNIYKQTEPMIFSNTIRNILNIKE